MDHKMRVVTSSELLSETFLILRNNDRDMITHIHWYSCKVSVIFVTF